jgi:hypothetical protein
VIGMRRAVHPRSARKRFRRASGHERSL